MDRANGAGVRARLHSLPRRGSLRNRGTFCPDPSVAASARFGNDAHVESRNGTLYCGCTQRAVHPRVAAQHRDYLLLSRHSHRVRNLGQLWIHCDGVAKSTANTLKCGRQCNRNNGTCSCTSLLRGNLPRCASRSSKASCVQCCDGCHRHHQARWCGRGCYMGVANYSSILRMAGSRVDVVDRRTCIPSVLCNSFGTRASPLLLGVGIGLLEICRWFSYNPRFHRHCCSHRWTKILLSRILPLEAFGFQFTLAVTICTILSMVARPILQRGLSEDG